MVVCGRSDELCSVEAQVDWWRAEADVLTGQSQQEKEGAISSELDTATNLRCSAWTYQHHVDPIGTAGTYAGYLLVEWPLPWPHDLSEVPELAPLVSALAGTGIRLQGLVATWPHGPERHAILYHPGDEASKGFDHFERREVIAPLDDLVASRPRAPRESGISDRRRTVSADRHPHLRSWPA